MSLIKKPKGHRLELRFPDWTKKETTQEERDLFTECCRAILRIVKDVQDAEIRIADVICGYYGLGSGALATNLTLVTDSHAIVEVRNN